MPTGLNLLATGNSLADTANAADMAVTDISRVGTGTLGFNSTAVTTVSGAPAATLNNLHTSTGEYFTFTMAPDPGYQLLLESFAFWARSGDATVPFEVTALLDGCRRFRAHGRRRGAFSARIT